MMLVFLLALEYNPSRMSECERFSEFPDHQGDEPRGDMSHRPDLYDVSAGIGEISDDEIESFLGNSEILHLLEGQLTKARQLDAALDGARDATGQQLTRHFVISSSGVEAYPFLSEQIELVPKVRREGYSTIESMIVRFALKPESAPGPDHSESTSEGNGSVVVTMAHGDGDVTSMFVSPGRIVEITDPSQFIVQGSELLGARGEETTGVAGVRSQVTDQLENFEPVLQARK